MLEARERTAIPPAGDITALADFRSAPEFLPIFTPRLRRQVYATFVSALPLDQVLRRLEALPQLLHPPGSWQATATLPLDAFGESGTYDKPRLARAYGSTRVMVARGPVVLSPSNSETWTLFSPYPTPTLDRLEPGTLLITLRPPI
jgi:hypothetical protein